MFNIGDEVEVIDYFGTNGAKRLKGTIKEKVSNVEKYWRIQFRDEDHPNFSMQVHENEMTLLPSRPKSKCDCGAEKCGSPGHSTWCSAFRYGSG